MKNNKHDNQTAAASVKLGPQLSFAANEAYSLLRTNLAFSFPDQEGGKVVGITSSHPQEGKSYTSINLAYSLAEDGKKVALVDADLRKSNMVNTLKLDVKAGVSDYLAHKVEDIDSIRIDKIMTDNFSILPAGNVPPNPGELVGSARMEDLLKNLAQAYDYVIVDLPPVLDVSDAVIITKYLDGIIVVVRDKVTRRSELKETVRRLKFSKVRLIGYVYNVHGDNTSHYAHHGYYGKHGYYGESSAKAEKK